MKYRVDIDSANKAKSSLSEIIDNKDSRVLNKVGAFSSLFYIDLHKYREPVLVLKTEEPGSKQVLAFAHDRIESVCYDMINHLINDCICMGAEPLAVQDLIVCSTMEPDKVNRIVKACAAACSEQGCVLTGGETTQQPDVVPDGTYILGSSIVGVVDKKDIIDGSRIVPGDKVIAIESNGLHTNGYTLVRDLLKKRPSLADEPTGNRSFLDALLEPHMCYYNSLKELFGTEKIKGLAHITGGGIRENLNRILPGNTDAEIDLGTYRVQKVFSRIKSESGISDDEMLRTFNMGTGMTLVCSEKECDFITGHLNKNGINAWIAGTVRKGLGCVNCTGSFNYT